MSGVRGHIILQGAKNFRDFGGYPTQDGRSVKTGILYRADSLASLTEEDLVTLEMLGLRTVCDLRRGQELERSPTRWPRAAATRFLHLPLFLDSATAGTGSILGRASEHNSAQASRRIMLELYREMVLDAHAITQIRRYFELLDEADNMPLLVHCSGGKDRTGVLCALTLTLLGVDIESVMQDYMHSLQLYSLHIDRSRQSSGQVYDSARAGTLSEKALRPVYVVDPDYLNAALDAISAAYGDINGYLVDGLGMRRTQIERIRDQLTQ